MKIVHVSIHIDFSHVMVLKRLVQEALRAAEEDLALVEELNDESARSVARMSISSKRDTYQELEHIVREAREKFYDAEYDDDGE